MTFPWLTPDVRRWIYGVCAAVGALAVGLNWAGEHTIALVLAVIAAILSPAIAIPNVPPNDPTPAGERDDDTAPITP